ncbi:MAG: lipoprotein signal peptidase, partial [Proteobacteria bacterium]|nr:lipoprotein signal peptidase [Pseudomonadota bacterium]
VDFLDFSLGEYHWPAFNIADSAIFIGVVLLSVHSMFIDTKSNAKDTA